MTDSFGAGMTSTALSLREYTASQLRGLCAAVGLPDNETPTALLAELLGTAGERLLSQPPAWPSDIADDHTPVEYSVAFDGKNSPTLRLFIEASASVPGVSANTDIAQRLLGSLAPRYGLCLDRFNQVRDLFLPQQLWGKFGMWYSVIFHRGSAPDFKIYFNAEVSGPEKAPDLVAEALRRLGLPEAYELVARHALQRAGQDRLTFFSLDLHAHARSRVKVYVSHHDAGAWIAHPAALAVPGADPDLVRDFCSLLGGGAELFTGRPMVSSYAFTEAGSGVPNNYSLYLPIRMVVSDDEEARERVRVVMDRCGMGHRVLDRALAAVSTRKLRDGVGLIPHVSLRTGPARPGITVYLSSEAYATTPPRPRTNQLANI